MSTIASEAAADIRSLYIQRRRVHVRMLGETSSESDSLHPKWDGGRDTRGVNHKPVWPALGDFAVRNNIVPAQWVDALFTEAHAFDHVPRPSDLKDPRVLGKLRDHGELRREETFIGLRTEMLLLQKEIAFRPFFGSASAEAAARAAVTDPLLDVSPLARFAAAVDVGLVDLQEIYKDRALSQYLSDVEAARAAFARRPKVVELLSSLVEGSKCEVQGVKGQRRRDSAEGG